MRSPRRDLAFAALLVACLSWRASARAQVLPWQRFDVAQGLPATRVTAIERDPRGWMWVATWEGLALVQGGRIRALGVTDGLPRAFVNDVAVSARGEVWVATKSGGLARLLADAVAPAEPSFERVDPDGAVPLRDASCLTIDGDGTVWCGTDDGIWRVETGSTAWVATGFAPGVVFAHSGQACADADGFAWLAAGASLWSARDGRVTAFEAPSDDGGATVVTPAHDGTLLVGFERGVWTFDPRADEARRWTRRTMSLPDGALVRAIVDDDDGGPWIGTTRGLVHGAIGRERIHGRDGGLADESVRALALGPDREPWVGTWSAGVARLASRAIVSWLPGSNAPHLAVGRGGVLVALESGLAWIDGADRVRALDAPARFVAVGQRMALDARGAWWLAGDEGLWRCEGDEPDLARATRLDDARCAPREPVFGTPGVGADGALWYAERSGRTVRLALDEAGRVAQCVDVDAAAAGGTPARYIHVRANGDAWLLGYDRIVRWRDGKSLPVELSPGVPSEPRCALSDRDGHLWIGTRFRGLWRCDAPDAEEPSFERVPLRVASDAVWSIAEDARGRLYLGTARGLVRFDPGSLACDRVGVEHGLAGEIVTTVVADGGRVWCATSGGVSRIDVDAATRAAEPPRTWIVRVRAGGADVRIPARGVERVDALELPADAASIELECAAPGEGVAYQHRFGSGSAIERWSEPRPDARLELARLAPGEHRVEVRAVVAGVSGEPAILSVRVLPPWWRTGWFLALVALGVSAVVALVVRARRERLRALDAVRRRIADDVHDEVGAGLAQIAILAESARAGASAESDARLRETARIARALRGSVADIVRALDPTPEDLTVLATRVRQIAANLFESQGAEVHVNAAGLAGRYELDAARRRHVLLAIAELLANAARHAQAGRVDVEIVAHERELVVTVADDGRGFDARAPGAGHGLEGLRRRAEALRGVLTIDAEPGKGTRAELRVPLG